MFKERKLNIGPAVRKQQAFPRVYGTFSVLLCPLPSGGGDDNLPSARFSLYSQILQGKDIPGSWT